MAKPRLLLLAGLVVLAASAMLLRFARPNRPGRIVPEPSLLVWQAPTGLSKAPAKVRFVLNNPGGSPVRILAARPGCGCTEPKVEPDVIAGGGRGYVDVEARYFPVGEKRTPIVLETDSPVTPRVELVLHMIGRASPPFLLRADGDLSYMGDFDPAETREVVVHTIEAGGRTKTPTFAHVPDFLRIEPAGVTETPYVLPGTFAYRCAFRVSFASPPPPGASTHEFFVVDPWDSGHKERLGVLVDFAPPVRVVPPLVVVRPGETSRFLVVSKGSLTGVRIVMAGDPPLPIEVSSPSGQEASRALTFLVRLKPGAATEPNVEGRIVVAWDAGGRVEVPVVLKKGDVEP